MADQTPAELEEKWDAIGEQFLTGFATAWVKSDGSKFIVELISDVVGALVGTAITAAAPLGIVAARAIAKSEDVVAPVLSTLAADAVNDMFGTKVSPSAFDGSIGGGHRRDAASAIGRGLIEQLTGKSNGEPSDEPAAEYLTVVTNMALEGWYQGFIVEFLTHLMPEQFAIGQIDNFGALDEKMSEALGFGRLTRRVLSPLVDATIVEPLKWKINKTYRTQLLSAGTVAQQVARGRWTREKGIEELARQGWSDERIEAMFNQARKFFGAGDVRTFVDRGHWTRDRGLQHLADQGYEHDAAEDAIRLEGLRRFDQLEGQEAAQIVAAYAARDISRSDFDGLLREHVTVDTERALYTELAELRQALNVKHLTASEAAQAVKARVLAVSDYRAALRREGYTEEAVFVKELMLRFELDKEKTAEAHRAEAEAERAAERQAKADALAAKRAQIAADDALKRRGTVATLERAAVRGLIPFARLEEVLSASYDADTVAIMRDVVEQDRQAYLDAQQRAADIAQRAETRGIAIADLRAAVFAHLLTVQEFRARLAYYKLNDADADLLTETVGAELADRDAAIAARQDAAAAAAKRSIDLGRFEQLVRRGARSMAEYDALLQSLDFDDASRAAMRDLLQLRIDDDVAAADIRQSHDVGQPSGALTIDQFRRAVLLDLKTETQFDAFLTSLGLGADQHALLVAELADDVAQAQAARQRRALVSVSSGARALPLATVARAARLGIVTPATYQARLVEAGYTPDDVAIELELLLTEIADVQAARTRRDVIETELVAKGLSLADVARAVRAGVASLEDYRGKAASLGLSAADVSTLTRVLADELSETKAATARRDAIASELDGRKVSLSVLEQRVRDGSLTLDGYVQQLDALGYALDDVDMLATLLRDELEA